MRNTRDPVRLVHDPEGAASLRSVVELLGGIESEDAAHEAWLDVAEQKVAERLRRHVGKASGNVFVGASAGATKKLKSNQS